MYEIKLQIKRLSIWIIVGCIGVTQLQAQPIQNLPTPVDTTSKGSLVKPEAVTKEEVEKSFKIEAGTPQMTVVQPAQPISEPKPAAGTIEEVLYHEKLCRTLKDQNCIQAGQLIMSEKPPKQIFDLDSSVRAKRALRLYEVAITADNLEAMEYAYDLYYDPYTILRAVNSYGDKARAMEIREVMVSKKYAGGLLRVAQDYLDNPEYLLSMSKKREACQIIKQNLTNTQLTEKSKEILNTLKNDLTCKVMG
jgi:hypothetical protein